MGKAQVRWAQLAPECDLGVLALAYYRKLVRGEPTHMRLTGDGCVAFGWRENFPGHTQEPHFTDDATGQKYDCGEYSVRITEIVNSNITE